MVITSNTLRELKLMLASIDTAGYSVVAMLDQGLAFAPFRLCFCFNNDPIMYCVYQRDLALEFSVRHFMGWLQTQLPQGREWVAHVDVSWVKLMQMIDMRIQYEDGIDPETSSEDDHTTVFVYSVSSDRTHQCWTLFNQYWNTFFPNSPIDPAWS